MAAAIALWLTNKLVNAQTARNSTFPEAADHPVVAVGFLAMSAGLEGRHSEVCARDWWH